MRFLFGVALFCYLIVIIVGFSFENECSNRITYKHIHINAHLDKEALLLPPDSIEISLILEEWKSLNYDNDEVVIINEFNHSLSRKTIIIEHQYEGRKHYGALILPKGGFKPSAPLLVLTPGLNQRQPTVNLNRNQWFQKMITGLEDMAILIPSFRGQALRSGDNIYCSDGFFGDAYDGAAIDALRLMAAAEKLYPTITDNTYVYGISRGATVATLMAARNSNISMVIAQSGPYDFMGDHAYKKYGLQFKYQFLSRKMDKEAIRKKIISSSPRYFTPAIESDVMLIHGRNDEVCSFEKAVDFLESFPTSKKVNHKWVEGGHGLYEFSYAIEKIKEHRIKTME